MTPRIDGIVFDMDGLLLDTERMALEAYLTAAADLDIPDATEDLYFRLIGRPWHTTRSLVQEALGGEDAERLLAGWTESFEGKARTEGIPKKPGVDRLLGLLESHGTPLALATSTGREKTLEQLGAVGLLDRFKAMATGDEVPNGKPSPDIYLLAAQRLEIDPASCMALEDSEPGVEAARAAGMRVIMVPDLKQPTGKIRALTERVCLSLMEAEAFLGTLL